MKYIKYVTPLQYKILEICKLEFKKTSEVADLIGKKPNVISFTMKRMSEIGYMEINKFGYKSCDFNFIECKDVSTAKMRKQQEFGEMIEVFDELKAYVPDDETQTKVLKLYNAGFKRKEICKFLNMRPTEVLWTLIFLKEDTKSYEKDSTIILTQTEMDLFKLLQKKNINFAEILKKIKKSYDETQNLLMKLEDKGVIIIKVHKTHTEYIPLQNEVKLKEEKKDYEIEIREDSCKGDCSCSSDNRKCRL